MRDDDELREEYQTMVRAIGLGFHPDTWGRDYTSLPEGYTQDRVDDLVERAGDARYDWAWSALGLP